LGKKKDRLKELEKEMARPDFWGFPEQAAKISEEYSVLKKEVEEFDDLEVELGMIAESGTEADLDQYRGKFREKEMLVFLSGKYDRENAILTIHSGAGGFDAQDWGTMLLRMYERYAQKKGFKFILLDESLGEGNGPEGRSGIKEATVLIKGPMAFGLLKKENGVHRLVRMSPFSAKQLRHTSFALVEILPEFPKQHLKDMVLNPEDLKLDFYGASGPGGQYVNKRESAVRVTHVPTGISATCQVERLQGQNKERAIELLKMKLFNLMEETQSKELSKIKGDRVSASWGNQIRSYVLDPYKLVKDTRTDMETSNVQKVLNGELDEFIEAEIKLK
jgi:peptide chain release factor 2